jgi:hypothetical protein
MADGLWSIVDGRWLDSIDGGYWTTTYFGWLVADGLLRLARGDWLQAEWRLASGLI